MSKATKVVKATAGAASAASTAPSGLQKHLGHTVVVVEEAAGKALFGKQGEVKSFVQSAEDTWLLKVLGPDGSFAVLVKFLLSCGSQQGQGSDFSAADQAAEAELACRRWSRPYSASCAG